MERSSLAQYLEHYDHVEFYGPTGAVDRRALVRFARRSYSKAIPFGAHFSLDRDSYYCSEFVACALASVGGAPRRTERSTNPSLRVVHRWLGISGEEVYAPDEMIAESRYAGAFTRFPSRTTYHAYRTAKRELHRRFTDEQKLGNVFYRDGRHVKLRETIRRFIERAMDAFPGGDPAVTPAAIRRRVRALAAKAIGSWTSRAAAKPGHRAAVEGPVPDGAGRIENAGK